MWRRIVCGSCNKIWFGGRKGEGGELCDRYMRLFDLKKINK